MLELFIGIVAFVLAIVTVKNGNAENDSQTEDLFYDSPLCNL